MTNADNHNEGEILTDHRTDHDLLIELCIKQDVAAAGIARIEEKQKQHQTAIETLNTEWAERRGATTAFKWLAGSGGFAGIVGGLYAFLRSL